MNKLSFCFVCLWGMAAYANPCSVPNRMRFANLRLLIAEGARVRIQEKVDSLTKSEKHFQELLDRANLFIPIVERVLRKENLPLDFRYLVLQESALVADAISSSNAVGFWQFKEPAAREVSLTIDQHVDERMHITAATQAAARYLKKNQEVFNNWLYALLAYNEGRSGAQRFVKSCYVGATTMRIEPDEHPYVIHFLAYKIAFQNVLGRAKHPELYLHECADLAGKSVGDIARKLGIDKAVLLEYNKWLKHKRIPPNSRCTAIIPMPHACPLPSLGDGSSLPLQTDSATQKEAQLLHRKYVKQATQYPTIETRQSASGEALVYANGLLSMAAQAEETYMALARRAGLAWSTFAQYNDLKGVSPTEKVQLGTTYYLTSKRSKALVHFHVAQPGETWWSVSQKYGVKKSALLLKNRLRVEEPLRPGRVLWMRFIRPAKMAVVYEETDVTAASSSEAIRPDPAVNDI